MKYLSYRRKSTESSERQVLSLGDQAREVAALVDRSGGFEILRDYEEAKSAKTLGRPIFEEMLTSIEKGEAAGMVAYHPDRLARNAVDGARIIHLLTTGQLQDLKFVTFNFENTPEGRLFLFLLFGQATHYSEALSRSVKRGIQTKLRSGWRPGVAPPGYLNCKKSRTLLPDPLRFPLIQRALRLFLSGSTSASELHRLLSHDWAYRTLLKRRSGGKPLSLSAVYKLLRSPFYAGMLTWKGELFQGRHQAMISATEHERICALLSPGRTARPQRREFAFTGMMTCGECGRAITAETRTNRHGSVYSYYHCTRRRLDYKCRQPSVRLEELEGQVQAFLDRVSMPEKTAKQVIDLMDRLIAKEGRDAERSTEARANAIRALESQLSTLTDMALRGLLSDEEFVAKKKELLTDQARLESRNGAGSAEWFEPAKELILASVHAASAFPTASARQKRHLLQIAGSNPVLKDEKLSVHARLPFREWSETPTIPMLRGLVEDVRTLVQDATFESNRDTTNKLLPEKNKPQESKRKAA